MFDKHEEKAQQEKVPLELRKGPSYAAKIVKTLFLIGCWICIVSGIITTFIIRL